MIDRLILCRYVAGEPAPVEATVMLSALRRLTIEPGPDGVAGIYAGDGGEATVDLAELRSDAGLAEAHVTVSVWSRGLVDVVYDLASATGMTVVAEPGRSVFLTEGDQVDDLPEAHVARAHTCVDAAELHWWLGREAAEPAPGSAPVPRKETVTRGDALRSLFGVRRRD